MACKLKDEYFWERLSSPSTANATKFSCNSNVFLLKDGIRNIPMYDVSLRNGIKINRML